MNDAGACCAEGEADADFALAQFDEMSEGAVEADNGEKQAGEGQAVQEIGDETAEVEGGGDALVHEFDVVEGGARVEFGDGLADSGCRVEIVVRSQN